jgi:hypothetical protein
MMVPTHLPTTMGASNPRTTRPTSVAASLLLRPVRAVAFWTAVLLPFCALALLALGKVEPTLPTLARVTGLYVAAIVVGHGHRR